MAREPKRSVNRLDQPFEPRRRVPRPAYDPDTFGRFSEHVARYIGSWHFIAWMTFIVLAWILWNIFAPPDLRYDKYPFILLTLRCPCRPPTPRR